MKISFVIHDDTKTYANDDIRNTIINLADYTASNLMTKGYVVKITDDIDDVLQSQRIYDYCVVISPGTEFINGTAFFDALDELVKTDFFIAGHILDRTMHNAYYELHRQCYVINMKHWMKAGMPKIGSQERDMPHTLLEPIRSEDNYHDDYTPMSVSKGTEKKTYNDLQHGWQILNKAFEKNLPIVVFNEAIRNSKKHYYPESEKDYYEHVKYIDEKFNYCQEEFVHTDNTEWSTGDHGEYQQVVIPASGTLYSDLVNEGTVIFYDYNQKALDYWSENCPRKANVNYKFVKTNLLEDLNLLDHIDHKLKTFVNLSNVFSYEGTVAKYSLRKRISAQDKLVSTLEKHIDDVKLNFTQKADRRILLKASWHSDQTIDSLV